MSITPGSPDQQPGDDQNMGQFSVKTSAPKGSDLGDIQHNFAIFDIFADNSGREAHFAGQVAGLLNEKASELISGGWDDGVVANVHNFEILATK
jgi:hypothetical protein